MSLLVLLRHGQSTGNELGVFAGGGSDFELTAKGVAQAKAAGQAIQDIKIDKAFTSALKRTHQTLDSVFEGMGAVSEKSHHQELNERHWGEYEGLPNSNVSDEIINLWRTTMDNGPEKGEKFADIEARLVPFFTKTILPLLKSGKNVLVVGHGSLFRILRKYLEDKQAEEMKGLGVNNAEVVIYEVDQDGRITFKEKRSDHTEDIIRKD